MAGDPAPTAKKKLPVVATGDDAPRGKAARARAGGWAAFTDGGAVPGWITAARVVMVLALAGTIPTILGVPHGNRILWTMAIAALPFFWMTFGYHLWRRICPLAVVAQVGRLVGRPGTRKMGEWMGKHYLLVQFALLLVGLSLRLIATNGSAVWLAGFLGVVVVTALVVGFVYGGKTWCNFLCPVGVVEKIHTEPARSASGLGEPTSQCSPCVACKKHCPDIDLEQGYWKEASERPRRVVYFAWPGVVVAFYVYYYLVSGSWDYYFSGRWAYERGQPSTWLDPGFTFLPAVPRVLAAPRTLIACGALSFAVFATVERVVVARRSRGLAVDAPAEQRGAIALRVRHHLLAVAGWTAFNAFYLFAGQPSLRQLPGWVVSAWGIVVVFASTAMLLRRVGRTEDAYVHEKFAQKILKKWEWGDAPPSDDLKDIYLLHTERTKQREARLRAYKETVRELVADGLVTRSELVILDSLRAQLGISDKDHAKIVGELSAEERQLFDPAYRGSVEQRLAKQQYRKDLERLVVEAARLGASPPAGTLAQLRAERGIDEAEAQAELAAVLAPDGPVAQMYADELTALDRLTTAAAAAHHGGVTATDQPGDSASLALLHHLARRRAHEHAVRALGLLAVVTTRPEVEAVRAGAADRGVVQPAMLAPLGGVPDALRLPLVEAVGRLAADAEGTLTTAPILAIVADPSRHLRAAVAILLSRFDDADARGGLLALIDDGEVIVREAAVRALGARSRLTRDLLARVLADPDPRVRHAAVRAVSGASGSSAELPVLPAGMLTGSAIDPAAFAQTKGGVGKAGGYATLDANAAMAQLTIIEKMMLIRQVPIFAELDADDLEELAGIVEEYRVEAGKDLFREGEAGDAVFLIVKGAVRVFTGGTADRPERTLSELGAGACIGEMAVLDAAPRSATVRAIERTRTLRVPGDGFKRVMSERPEMSQAIVAELVRRMRGLMSQGGAPQLSSAALQLPGAPPTAG
jgi:NAD-dependent dihydropyrimidine dehydrogenase PreA subunit